MRRLTRIWWALIGVIALLVLAGHAPQQSTAPRPLIIVLRDMGSTPLDKVTVVLYQPGQTMADFVPAETDEFGEVVFTVRPGDYIVGFSGKWEGYRFIDLAKQNAGAMSSGTTGGFALYLDPMSEAYTFIFTVGLNAENQLVPFFDLAENLSDIPDPYLYDPETIGDEVSIDPVGYTDLTIAPLVPTPLSDEERQAVREERAQARSPLISTIVLVIALIFCGLIVVAMWYILITQSQAAEMNTRRHDD